MTECDLCKYPCDDKKGCEFGPPETAYSLSGCPFCGGGASISAKPVFHGTLGWRVECEGDCHGMTCWWHSKEEAIQNWNRRAELLNGVFKGGCMNGRIWAFAIYSLFFEAIIWGVFSYAVFWQGRSGWWILVAIIMSGCQLKPKHFGIDIGKSDDLITPT